MSTASICGTAGLPLPSGGRGGGRGDQPLDREPPHPTPLPCGEREQAVLAAYPWLHSTETLLLARDSRRAWPDGHVWDGRPASRQPRRECPRRVRTTIRHVALKNCGA